MVVSFKAKNSNSKFMAKITYEDKEFLNKNENIADKNKVNDTDLNQIKEVVNNTFYAGYTETAISDANEAKETGGYYTNANTTNLPINGSGGFLNVMYRSDDNITQVWTRYRDNQVFMRQKNTIEPSGWKEWERLTTEPTVLYENSNGSNGNITLSDDVDNYSAIEIYYKSDGDGNVMMTKVVSPFTRAALITMVVNLSGQYQGIFFRLAQVALSSNQLTVEKNGQLFGNGSAINNGSTNNNVRIIKILGYKY